jgi:cytochrome c-type biogenesis protein
VSPPVLLASTAAQIDGGSLLVAVPIATAAGFLSFLSPCVLPLVPGYLSYITGLSASELAEQDDDARPALESPEGPGPGGIKTRVRHRSRRRSRVVLGSCLFMAGVAVVFVALGAAFGGLGDALREHQDGLIRVFGAVTIVLGLSFAGLFSRLPIFNRELRFHRMPSAGLAGAPILGMMFGLGWTPCIGPTLSAVLGLAASSQHTTAYRGAGLAFAYVVGLGVPFVVVGLAFRRSMAALAIVKRHYALVMAVGGLLLVAIGLLEVTGTWGRVAEHLQSLLPARTLL